MLSRFELSLDRTLRVGQLGVRVSATAPDFWVCPVGYARRDDVLRSVDRSPHFFRFVGVVAFDADEDIPSESQMFEHLLLARRESNTRTSRQSTTLTLGLFFESGSNARSR